MRRKVDPDVIKFSKIIKDAGYSCFLVGGAVRNISAGLKVSDYDFTTDAKPEIICSLFRNVIPTGIKHGTVTVLFKNHKFEITTYREDGEYTDFRRPDEVKFTPDIFEDLKRRDFTINSMAYDVLTDELLDPHGGRSDLDAGIIKAIGNPADRFQEDALRIMRACRFAAQLKFQIETETFNGMKLKAENLRAVSAERIRDEIEKIFKTRLPSIAFQIMEKTGVMQVILPELSVCRGVAQKGYHDFDVLDHLLFSCDGAPPDNMIVRLAALLHDTGKPAAADIDTDGFPTFHGHEIKSVAISREIIQRFKFSKNAEARTLHLIKHHMFNYQDEWTDAAVRRFISRVGTDYINDLFILRRADQYGMKKSYADSQNLLDLKNRIDAILSQENAFSIRDLAVNGNMLNIKAGIPKGPAMGTVLEFLLESVLEDPELNTEVKLLKIADNFYRERINLPQ